MRPSERRALEAEKRAQKEAAAREKVLEKQAQKVEKIKAKIDAEPTDYTADESERVNMDAEYRKLPEEEIEVKGDGYHRESFFGNHVRLITFIITAALVLTVLGPWGIDMLVSKSRSGWAGGNEVEGIDITVNDFVRITELGRDITWKDFSGYSYDDSTYTKNGKTTYNHKYCFEENKNLCVEVIGYSDSGVPDIIRLIDYDSGEYIDVKKESARNFLAARGYIK